MVVARSASSIELASGNQPKPENYSASEIRREKTSCRMAPSTAFAKMSNTCSQPDRPLIRMMQGRQKNALAASAMVSSCPNKAAYPEVPRQALMATEEALVRMPVSKTPAARRLLADVRNAAPLPIDVTATHRSDSFADRYHRTDPPTDLELPQFQMGPSLLVPIC